MIILSGFVAMSAVSVDIMLPAVADISDAFGVAPGRAQYILTSYILGFVIGQMLWGELADRFGRRPIALIGLSVFCIASIFCVMASDFSVLIVSRLCQGVAGASGTVLSRAIVRDITSGPEIARKMATLTSILGMAPLAAPLAGSLILAIDGWAGIFLALLGYGMMLLVLSAVRLPETIAETVRTHSWSISMARGVQAAFASGPTRLGIGMLAATWFGYMALLTSSSSVLEDVYGVASVHFGYYFLAVGGAFVSGSVLSRKLVGTRSARDLLRLGSGFLLAASLGLSLVALNGASLTVFWSVVAVFGLGVGIVLPNATAIALEPLPHIAGKAAAVLGTVQMGAGFFGSALSALLYNQTATPFALILAGSGLMVALIYWRGSRNF